jgi:hypothetical protein
MARIPVTDGEERSALAIVRSLGRANHTVFVCWHASAHCRCVAILSLSHHGAESVAEPHALTRLNLCRSLQIDVLIPVSAALLTLRPHARASERFASFAAAESSVQSTVLLATRPELGI